MLATLGGCLVGAQLAQPVLVSTIQGSFGRILSAPDGRHQHREDPAPVGLVGP